MSEWIELSKEKPKQGQKCIIYGPSTWGTTEPFKVVYGEWDGYANGEEDFSIACGEYGTGVEATHWMPLPEPPKEQ